MRTSLPKSLRVIFGLVLVLLLTGPVSAQETAVETTPAAEPIPVGEVLVTEAVPLLLPAFHDEELAGVKFADLFDGLPAAPGSESPAKDRAFPSPDGSGIKWRVKSLKDGSVTFDLPEEGARVHYLAFYVTTDRWQKVSLTVTGDQSLKGVLDGASLTLAKKEADEDNPARHEGEMKLAIGKHLVVLRTMAETDPEDDSEDDPEADSETEEEISWELGLTITPDAEAGAGSLELDVSPDRPVDIQTVLNAPRISRVALSPDGSLAAIRMGEYRNGDDREQWFEVRDTETGRLEYLWRTGQAPGSVTWHPEGRKLTWQTNTGGKATIWLHDLDTGETGTVLADIEKLGGWAWAPDGGSLIYEISRTPDEDPRKVKRVLHPADRQPWWRGRSHLMQVFIPDGLTRRLTAGPVSASGWEISDDGKKMLFFTGEPDITQRPFSTTELWLMDLESLAVEKILSDPWISGAIFSPDGKTLCLQGSPSAFDGLGNTLPEGVQPNDYGGQLYLYDLAAGKAEAVALDFRPDISSVQWSRFDGAIYARTTDTQYNSVYRYKPGGSGWERITTGMEVTKQFTVAREAGIGLARGSSATTPNRLYVVDLVNNKARLLLDPGVREYQDIVFGKVDNWVAELPDGMKLDGFVYYPPDFDPAKKYPVIVYYYGGTSPITRDFGGRYPKNIWAGQGYVVYVPNPSGATGYGQEYAARHVNDWGILTAGEVIEGTKAFLAAHDFADPERVGCMGASYGGFLTEYIVTQTDIFAAAVSHAGISDISSYWGEGLWGYAYGSRALANSFPWKDRELFIEQSPLFHADKITTPLLLVHGDSDVNVPKGESDQLFTALKILGKEVEYVQIVGQDHHILDHKQRVVWNDTILAFLAKHLKERPGWWDEMYPAPEDYR
ncbi:MAG: S9 family peptidase [Candidatus Krumholzibacteriota bacterium]